MNNQQLSLFVDVVDLGSISKAAERHLTSPQTVSQQIRRLEEELGFTSLNRSPQGGTPTEAGKAYYEGCNRIVRNLNELSSRCRTIAKAEPRSILLGSAGSDSLSLFASFVPAFLKSNPSARIEYVHISDSPIEDLRQGQFDVVENIRPELVKSECDRGAPTEALDDEEISFLPLVTARRYCLVSTASPLAHLESISPADLEGVCVYVYNLDWAANLRMYLQKHSIEMELAEIPSRDRQTVLRTCNNGKSVFLAPEHLVGRYEELVAIPLDVDVHNEYGLLYRTSDQTFLANFLDSAKKAFLK